MGHWPQVTKSPWVIRPIGTEEPVQRALHRLVQSASNACASGDMHVAERAGRLATPRPPLASAAHH
eukprot:15136408-Alexandrium_andersonii.AAC.1